LFGRFPVELSFICFELSPFFQFSPARFLCASSFLGIPGCLCAAEASRNVWLSGGSPCFFIDLCDCGFRAFSCPAQRFDFHGDLGARLNLVVLQSLLFPPGGSGVIYFSVLCIPPSCSRFYRELQHDLARTVSPTAGWAPSDHLSLTYIPVLCLRVRVSKPAPKVFFTPESASQVV